MSPHSIEQEVLASDSNTLSDSLKQPAALRSFETFKLYNWKRKEKSLKNVLYLGAFKLLFKLLI